MSDIENIPAKMKKHDIFCCGKKKWEMERKRKYRITLEQGFMLDQSVKIYYNCIGAIEIEPSVKVQTSWLERKVATPAGKAWVLRPRRKWTSSEEAQAMPAESVHLKGKSTELESNIKGIAARLTTMPIF